MFVDRVPPLVKTTVLGNKQVLKRLHTYISYGDPPPPLSPGTDASGIAKVTVNWGDHTPVVGLKLGNHRSFHAYQKPGRYTVTVTVSDKAGNTTRTVTIVKVKPKPKPSQAEEEAQEEASGVPLTDARAAGGQGPTEFPLALLGGASRRRDVIAPDRSV